MKLVCVFDFVLFCFLKKKCIEFGYFATPGKSSRSPLLWIHLLRGLCRQICYFSFAAHF